LKKLPEKIKFDGDLAREARALPKRPVAIAV
jgi:hypothetical protein